MLDSCMSCGAYHNMIACDSSQHSCSGAAVRHSLYPGPCWKHLRYIALKYHHSVFLAISSISRVFARTCSIMFNPNFCCINASFILAGITPNIPSGLQCVLHGGPELQEKYGLHGDHHHHHHHHHHHYHHHVWRGTQ